MARYVHEIRDPIHTFIRLDDADRRVLNSRPFQRLRHIHQLAMTFLVYPGATHRRFEHSLGVMDLATRIFDVVTDPANVSEEVRNFLPELSKDDEKAYWRRVMRMAALCHDIGHLPFSHAAEKELLPPGWDHERLTRDLVSSDEMQEIWNSGKPPLKSEDIVKLAVGPKKAADLEFTDWEALVSEIIVGDAFGADRMDYLLRDSHHAGVAYGKFDHHRLIDTLRILPKSREDNVETESRHSAIGMEEGGIQSAEALMLARYLMYSQVYLHRVRRIYDIHLMDFLKNWLPGGRFPTDVKSHLNLTDSGIMDAIWNAAYDERSKDRIHARRIVRRDHFRTIYETGPKDARINPDIGGDVYGKFCEEFGAEYFRRDRYGQTSDAPDFPVKLRDGGVAPFVSVSELSKNMPVIVFDRVFVDRSLFGKARDWFEKKRESIVVEPAAEEEHDG